MKIDITDDAFKVVSMLTAIRGTRNGNEWTVDIPDDIYQRILAMQSPNETFSFVLIRGVIGSLIRKLMDDGWSTDQIIEFCAENGITAEFMTQQ